MVREAGVAIGKTTYGEFTTTNMYTAPIEQNARFKNDGTGATVATLQEFGAGTATAFYLRNNNAAGSPSAKITMVASFEGASAASDIRLAVFVKNDGDADYYYAGTLASAQANTHFGTVIRGAASDNLQTYEANGTTLNNFVQIDPSKNAQIQIVAWYEGVGLTTVESGQSNNFTLTFTAQ